MLEGLKEVFQTKNDVLILTASGTGAMEAAVVNAVPPGGKAMVLSAGYFGARWDKICKAFGINAVVLETEWGQPVDPDQVAAALAAASRHGLRAGHLERDLDGDRPSGRGDRPDRRRDARPLRGRRDLGRRRHGVPDRRMGHRPALRRLAESPDAPAGPGVRGGQPQGLGQDRHLRLAQLLLQPEGGPQEDQGVRHAVHAGPHLDSRPCARPCGGSRRRASRTSGSAIAR